MNWQEAKVRSRSVPKITFRSTSIAFSAEFIKRKALTCMQYVTILQNEEHRRIAFLFKDTPTVNSLAMQRDGGCKKNQSGNSRIVFVNIGKKIPWLDGTHPSDKTTYIPIQGEEINLFYIEIAFQYSDIKPIPSLSSLNSRSGVYRLYNERYQILRIGEGGDIVRRIEAHLKRYTGIEYFDFFEINDRNLRRREEHRLLAEYKSTHNDRLPVFNPINA